MSRQLGVVFFMLGSTLWLARKEQSPVALRATTIGLFSGNALGFVVALLGQLRGRSAPSTTTFPQVYPFSTSVLICPISSPLSSISNFAFCTQTARHQNFPRIGDNVSRI